MPVCDNRECKNSLPLSADDYERLRAELFKLFNLRNPDFTIKDLLKEQWYVQWNPAHVSLGGGVSTTEGMGAGERMEGTTQKPD